MSASDRAKRKRIRKSVIERDGPICCFCECYLEPEEISLDHLVPDSRDGSFCLTNLTVACKPCNQRRGHRNFFEFAAEFDWPTIKITKYFHLFVANSKIKILQVGRKKAIQTDKPWVPKELISWAHSKLKDDYWHHHPTILKDFLSELKQPCKDIQLSLSKPAQVKRIKQAFSQLITIIETPIQGD
jgi:HNH endonuclease